MKNFQGVSLLITASLVLSCTEPITTNDARTDGPYFPKMIETATEQMEALLTGKLVLKNRCFQIEIQDTDESFTPIWPAGFDYQLTTDSVFIILNDAGNEVARTGAGIRVSGGETRNAEALDDLIEGGASALLLSCAVPYWIVGNEISTVNLAAGLSPTIQNALAPWFSFYAPHIEDWRLRAFAPSGQHTFEQVWYQPDADVYPIARRPVNWMISSPDGRFNLDLFARDKSIGQNSSGKTVITALSPASEVALEDLDSGNRRQLLFCGTPCRFEAAFWEDDQTVVVAGLQKGERDQYHPMIWRISFNENNIQEYTYPTPLPNPFPHNYISEVVFSAVEDK